ncbi:trypsin-like peptidase domain-containing protein [Acidipropionibacterium jensenii]|nr:trypsin-like peptidase domain-containing protein [Acidipropionibacterium jensenii]
MDDSNRSSGEAPRDGAEWSQDGVRPDGSGQPIDSGQPAGPGQPAEPTVWSGWDTLDASAGTPADQAPKTAAEAGGQSPTGPGSDAGQQGHPSPSGSDPRQGDSSPWGAESSQGYGYQSQPSASQSNTGPYSQPYSQTWQDSGTSPYSSQGQYPGQGQQGPYAGQGQYPNASYPGQGQSANRAPYPGPAAPNPSQGAGSAQGFGSSQGSWGQGPAGQYAPPASGPATTTQRGRGTGMKAGAVALVAVLAAGAGGLSGWAVSSQTQNDAATTSSSVAPSASGTRVIQGNASNPDWTATAKAVSNSVVSISVKTGQGTGAGSGVVLNTKGDIVTNNHVVAAGGSGGTIAVSMGDKTYEATIVGTDPSTDLAVIRLGQVPKDLTPITLGNSDQLAVGAPVMAIGNPLGLSGSVTTGIISALNRPVTTSTGDQGQASGSDSAGVVVTSAIQTSAPINPGNSGGALVNADGQLIGINSSIASLSSGSSNSQSGSIGIGFAIPVNQVKIITDQLIASGKARHAYLGVTTATGTATVAGVTTTGATVRSVQADSPADRAGIREGDVVISMNSTTVTSGESLVGLVRSRKVGERVTLTVVRDGSQQKIQVTLAASAR